VDVCDGNQDDTTWSRQALLGTGGTLTADVRAEILFVADSKLLSHETVADLCESRIRFVSRLPNTFGLERATKAATAARPLSARNDAASYRICETQGQLGGHDVRFIVVHSSALEAKARHQEVARLEKDAQRLDRAIRAWDQRRFACVEDATTAWEEWQQTTAITQSTWSVAGAIVEILPDGPTSWTVQVTRTEPATPRIQAERWRRSTFILVSNDPRRSARELLEAYKTQFVVEQRSRRREGAAQHCAPLFERHPQNHGVCIRGVHGALVVAVHAGGDAAEPRASGH
jgi:hypothetical protein